MSALSGSLRATLRMRGTWIFWIFYVFLLLVSLPILARTGTPQPVMVIAALLGFAAWMGWLLFLSRLWQLQQQAESLGFPGARASVERAAVLMVLIGTSLPVVLLYPFGAAPGWILLGQWAALALALLYLMLTPTLGVLLVLAVSVLPVLAVEWLRPLMPDADSAFYGLWALVALFLLIGASRWRRLLNAPPAPGWNAPQVIGMAERGLSGSRAQTDDPTLHWVSGSGAELPAGAGPQRPALALSVMLCGPLAPLGWRNYLRGSGWMLLAIGFLGALSLTEDPISKGPGFGLLALLGVWSLAVPLTLITRFRQLWRDEGHALAEAALLPGLARTSGSWWQMARVVLLTTAYRLALPAVLICLLLAIRDGDPMAPLLPLATAAWALLLTCCLLPLARRASAAASFLLYAAVALILIGVIATLVGAADYGIGAWWRLQLPLSIPVLLLALAGWRWPRTGQALVKP